MAPILLRLLLCLCLVVDTTAAAWAATGMAAPVPEAGAGCHEAAMAGMSASADMPMDHHAAGKQHASCCKGGGCDCLQHCGVALALPAPVRVAATRASQPRWTLHARRGDPAPYRPVRPPIA